VKVEAVERVIRGLLNVTLANSPVATTIFCIKRSLPIVRRITTKARRSWR
jgi:hypothetical protein